MEHAKLSVKVDEAQAHADIINNYIDEVLYTRQVDGYMAIYSLFDRGGLENISKNLDSLSKELQTISDQLADIEEAE